MTKKEMSEAIHAIRKFVYYGYNYCDMQSVCNQVWAGDKMLAKHFYSKLVGYDYNFNRWYVEMSFDNQDKLARWLVENYHDVDTFRRQDDEEPQSEPTDTDPDTFVEYCQQHIADKIYGYVGQTFYSDDLPYTLTEEENVNGTITFSAEASKNLIKKYWGDAGEYWEYEKSAFGANTYNPFDAPEAYFVCMVIQGVNSLLSQTDIMQNMDGQFELTEELADKIVEQSNEISKIW